ncbi:hypothetical protein SY83_01260 [Paenibacillus swuensis]|uniref:Uncharacterized protein n=1 Tax=Paenibacillus swuensis TaxID=1178515 RepID=A0A172TE42_9BACL|nr:hypothetical protein [Paenibacillus swuensis]ANE45184.1 hypothetical protein SY83_01260 [Paenibacillus swuensis]
MNKTFTWLIFAAVFTAWAGNYYVYQSHKLEKPLFLRHYYEMPSASMEHFKLYYLTNRESKRAPIFFVTASGLKLTIEQTKTRDEQGRIVLKEAYIAADKEQLKTINNTLSFNNLTAHYNDGTSDSVEIGEMIVHPVINKIPPLESRSGGGSNQGTGYNGFVANRNVTISAVSHSFPSQLSDVITTQFKGSGSDNTNQFPMVFRKGEAGYMDYTFRLPKDDPRINNAYQIMFSYLDDKRQIAGFMNTIEQPQLYSGDLDDYIRTRKEELQR